MFKNICEKLVLNGINSGNIEADKKDDYTYGMNMLFNIGINIISMIIIGIITHRLWECIVFCLVYKFIRKYTGGFHFKSAFNCYISSCAMYLAAIGIAVYLPFRTYETSAIVLISAITLWCLSPVEAVNKPLDKHEMRVFKKRARINIMAISITYIISLFIYKEFAYIIGIGIIMVMIFAIIGKIKLIQYIEREKNC